MADEYESISEQEYQEKHFEVVKQEADRQLEEMPIEALTLVLKLFKEGSREALEKVLNFENFLNTTADYMPKEKGMEVRKYVAKRTEEVLRDKAIRETAKVIAEAFQEALKQEVLGRPVSSAREAVERQRREQLRKLMSEAVKSVEKETPKSYLHRSTATG